MKNRGKIKNMTHIALYAVFLAICSWIAIPFATPMTLQTFGVFFVLFYAGGKKGLASIALYISLGIIGLPVFAGFRGGFGVLFEHSGGYIIGFLAAGCLYFAAEAIFPKAMQKAFLKYFVAAIGLLTCHALGALSHYNFLLSVEKGEAYWVMLAFSLFSYGILDAVKIAGAGFFCFLLRDVKA